MDRFTENCWTMGILKAQEYLLEKRLEESREPKEGEPEKRLPLSLLIEVAEVTASSCHFPGKMRFCKTYC